MSLAGPFSGFCGGGDGFLFCFFFLCMGLVVYFG